MHRDPCESHGVSVPRLACWHTPSRPISAANSNTSLQTLEGGRPVPSRAGPGEDTLHRLQTPTVANDPALWLEATKVWGCLFSAINDKM